jgi:hypothetical protein
MSVDGNGDGAAQPKTEHTLVLRFGSTTGALNISGDVGSLDLAIAVCEMAKIELTAMRAEARQANKPRVQVAPGILPMRNRM